MGTNTSNASFQIEGLQVAPGEANPHGDPHMINPDYFRAMGIQLLKGRFFTDQDTSDSLPVAIIDETLAERYWPNEEPLGKRIAAFFDRRNNQPVLRQIVGVVGHVKQYGLDGKTKVQYYFPLTQRPQRQMNIVVRSTVEPTSLVGALTNAIRSVDSDQPIFNIRTMEQVVSNSVATKRFATAMLSIFSAVALVLAAVGLYGVISYSVTQRTHEIGIRMALGARSIDVVGMVMGNAAMLTGTGVVIGLAAAFALTRLIAGLLFSVGATDAMTFTAVPLLLCAVGLLASYIPARRATKVDPMIALRYE
jgi:putative ABC transport system permease protein